MGLAVRLSELAHEEGDEKVTVRELAERLMARTEEEQMADVSTEGCDDYGDVDDMEFVHANSLGNPFQPAYLLLLRSKK